MNGIFCPSVRLSHLLPEASIGLRVLSSPVCVCVNFFCPGDNSPHVPARIIKFGQKKFNKFCLRSLLFLVLIDFDLPGQI